ncbi:cytochrome P450 3A29-like [Glandiceps talaboti]
MELFGFSTTIPLVVAVIFLLYLYATWTFSTFKKLGIPGPKPLPLVGNMFELISNGMAKKDVEWTKKYGKLFGIFEGRSPLIVVSDPEMVKQICVKKSSSFYNKRRLPLESKPLDSALNNLIDGHWKKTRNTLTPAFSASKMKLMSPLISVCADIMQKNLDKLCKEGTIIQCKDVFGCFVVDSVGSAGFGVSVNSQEHPKHPFVENAKKAFSGGLLNPAILIMFFCPPLVPVLNWLKIGIVPRSILNYFVNLMEETINVRMVDKNATKRTDLLQLMMNAHDVYEEFIKNNEQEEDENGVKLVKDGRSDTCDIHKGFTNEEMLAQSLLFFLAGYETTSTLMSFAAYCLATNHDIQVKLQAEIDEVMANYDTPNYEAVSKMPYLDMVISETLRMYPPAGRFDRVCNEDVNIGGFNIPDGMVINVAVYAIHHNPEIYPEPERFDPERFTKEEKEKRHPYAWLPFGAGPRNCIGMRFGLLEAKIGLVHAFKNFTFEPCAETEIPPKLGKAGMLMPEAGIKLKVRPR